MKVALAQFNPTVGALCDNSRRMLRWVDDARSQGARLIVFPELSLCGYSPRDLLERPAFVRRIEAAANQLVADSPNDIVMVFGSVARAVPGSALLANQAIVAQGGQELSRAHKQLLPTYDVFDEARYFVPGMETAHFVVDGVRVATTICEDAWAADPALVARYAVDPLEELAQKRSADLVLNLSASPFTLSKWHQRGRVFQSAAERLGAPVVCVNQVGGNDELIFDGRSAVYAAGGRRVLGRAEAFVEQLLVVDLEQPGTPIEGTLALSAAERAQVTYQALVLGVRDYFRKCGVERAVLGLSGGIDSALTAAIAADALGPTQVTGVAMPSRYSSEGSLSDARELATNLGIGFEVVEIEPMFRSFSEGLGPVLDRMAPPGEADTTMENLQARARGVTLMALSNRTGALVLTTGNKSELAVGYCTLYGDMAGGLAVISDVPKTLVYEMAREVNRLRERIPIATIEKPPSAELRPGQTDQDSLPPYDLLDAILECYVEEHLSPQEIVAAGYPEDEVSRVVRLIKGAEYKRKQAAPGLIVTRKAFGCGRRVPIACALPEPLHEESEC